SSFTAFIFDGDITSSSRILQYSLYCALLLMILYFSSAIRINRCLLYIVRPDYKVCHIVHVFPSNKQKDGLACLRMRICKSSCIYYPQYQKRPDSNCFPEDRRYQKYSVFQPAYSNQQTLLSQATHWGTLCSERCCWQTLPPFPFLLNELSFTYTVHIQNVHFL